MDRHRRSALHLPNRIAARQGFCLECRLLAFADEASEQLGLVILLDIKELASNGVGQEVTAFRVEAVDHPLLPHDKVRIEICGIAF